MSERAIVEAALFSAGRPLAVEDVVKTTGLTRDMVSGSLEALARAYDEQGSAVEVVRIGEKWTMQIRAEYGEKAHAFVPPELPRDLLKTAALIAYHQPVRQSDLVRMEGARAYEHVRALADRGLIATRPVGQTLELRTTASFPEFFGLAATDREELKRLLETRTAGSTLPAPKASEAASVGLAESSGVDSRP